jgi:AraC-like DNA-binding protein
MVIGWGEHRPSHVNMPERHEMMQMMTRIEFPELAAAGYGVELTQIDQVAFIIGFHPDPSQDERVRMRNIVEAVRENLLEFVDTAPRIGVGTCYPSPDQWNQSYIEAYTAFEMSVPGNPAAVTYFDQLPHPAEHVYWIPNQLLMKLSQSLKQGSFEVASEMIRSAVRFLHAPDYSPMLKRCISFDILNTLLKTAAELGSQHSLHDQAPGVVFSPSLEELERNLLKLASDICDQVVAKQRQQEQSLMDRIVDYVDRHFTDHMLSLESVAFAFSVSPSHVSRSFKEKTGVNFSQYVWQKRLDEVKRRLIATDDPLKDIIAQVGYLDAPNFIRKFKKAIGCTPGQYRKMHT